MKIVVIDYGMGNLRSVSKALEKQGAQVFISSNPRDIIQADKLVLPGVGSFGEAMKELNVRKLIDPIHSFLSAGKPFLGICLGLQLLFESSEESPGTPGLGLLKGTNQKFCSNDIKIPHMGWNSLNVVNFSPLLEATDGDFFYFVHSYYAVPAQTEQILAVCTVGTETFPAIVGHRSIIATQFHPEKSQSAGLRILKKFVEV